MSWRTIISSLKGIRHIISILPLLRTENGKSADTAFDSLEDINGIEFAAGDEILIKAGSEFRGQLYPKGSGSEKDPIVIDMYGEGGKAADRWKWKIF